MLGLFRIFRNPLVIAIAALAATNTATFLAAKHYHSEAARAVAECNADKLEATADAQRLRADALQDALRRTNEEWARYRAKAESSIRQRDRALEDIFRVNSQLRDELDAEIADSYDGCLVERWPDSVRRSIADSREAYFGGGREADADPDS